MVLKVILDIWCTRYVDFHAVVVCGVILKSFFF